MGLESFEWARRDALTQTDLAGTPSAEFIFFNGKRIARLDLPGAAVHYYFSDHLGSASVVTSATGTIQDESDYYPFGGERIITNTDPNQYKFTGKERDCGSGLDEFGARYYASNLGRFTIPDWAATATSVPYADFTDPQSLNLFGYVRNNPLSHADADGHCCDSPWDNSILVQSYRTDSRQFKAGCRTLSFFKGCGFLFIPLTPLDSPFFSTPVPIS